MQINELNRSLVCFDFVEEAGPWLQALSPRQQRLVWGAANFHVLENPSELVIIHVHEGPAGSHLFLTDESTVGVKSSGAYAELGVLHVKLAGAAAEPTSPGIHRSIRISADRRTDDTAPRRRLTPYWWLRSQVEQFAPAAYDALRQEVLARRERRVGGKIDRRSKAFAAADPKPHVDGPRAVLIGMHWFELGGAESWAFRTIELVKAAGLLPIVIADKAAQHELIGRPALDGCIVIPLTHPMEDDARGPDEVPLLRALVERVHLVGVVIHHCHWLYDRLPFLKQAQAGLPVVDSLHIIEDGGGGYPAIAVHLDEFIDVHHVISPQLVRWLVEGQRVDASKVVLAPLVGLSIEERARGEFRPAREGEPFTLAFVGRFVRQKRPYLFLAFVNALRRRSQRPIRVILHGDGELAPVVDRLVRRFDLADVIERRTHHDPVGDTLEQSHVLVISSQNEGITLTTLEALAHGLPVLSADVGSQSTLVTGDLLVPRRPHDFIAQGTSAVLRLMGDERIREEAWRQQFAAAAQLSTHESAEIMFERLVAEWA